MSSTSKTVKEKFLKYWFVFNGACYNIRCVDCCINCKHHKIEVYRKQTEIICYYYNDNIVVKSDLVCDNYCRES